MTPHRTLYPKCTDPTHIHAEVQVPVTTHTPGPWEAATEADQDSRDGSLAFVRVFSISDSEYAPARAYGDDTAQMWANARLIAAAPALLALLAKFAEYATKAPSDSTGQSMVAYRAALRDEARALLAQLEG